MAGPTGVHTVGGELTGRAALQRSNPHRRSPSLVSAGLWFMGNKPLACSTLTGHWPVPHLRVLSRRRARPESGGVPNFHVEQPKVRLIERGCCGGNTPGWKPGETGHRLKTCATRTQVGNLRHNDTSQTPVPQSQAEASAMVTGRSLCHRPPKRPVFTRCRRTRHTKGREVIGNR